MPSTIAEVDGIVFTGRFEGFGQPLEVDVPIGRHPETVIRLLPWRYRDHMDALRDCVFVTDSGIGLDRNRFATRVLHHAAVPEKRHGELAPLALWWAAGGDAPANSPEPGGTLDLGSWQVRLRRWSERERLTALLAARTEGAGGEAWLDVIGYLDAMVRASAADIAPPASLDALDSRASTRLLDAVVALNVPDPKTDPILRGGPMAQQVAQATLFLCKTLGWTPSEVWAAPAAEINRLLQLLALTQEGSAGAPTQPRRGLASDPRATVFRFVDEET